MSEAIKQRIKVLVSERRTFLSQITRIENTIQQGRILSMVQLRDKKERLQSAIDGWKRIQTEINTLLPEVDDPNFALKHEQVNEDYDEKVEEIRDALADIQSTFTPVEIVSSDEGRGSQHASYQSIQSHPGSNVIRQGVKLPELKIEKFSGNILKWAAFKDQFDAAIGMNEHLSGCEKFQYLKALLDGKPYQLMLNRRVSNADYESAISLLQETYDKPHLIVDTLLHQLQSASTMTKRNSEQLQLLLGNITEVSDGLTAVGDEWNSRDTLLCFLIYRKLDNQTRYLWDELNRGAVPTMEGLMKFLRVQADALLRSSFEQVENLEQKQQKTYTTKMDPCILCSEVHLLYNCSKFKEMNVVGRREFVSTNRICFNCLRGGHTAITCTNTHRCKDCSRPHHSLLHTPIVIPQATLNIQASNTNEASTNHTQLIDL